MKEIYITEINQSNDGDLIFNDFDLQSRVIEYSSWDDYVNLYKNYSGEVVEKGINSIFKGLYGAILPKGIEILELTHDDHKLVCYFKYSDGRFNKKVSVICK